jgi:hypothetical protein
MAQINFVVRQLIKFIYGASLAPGTFSDALLSYQSAVQLNPARLIHRVELGRTYLKLGHKAEALRELRASLELEVEDVNAALERDEAALMIERLAPRSDAFERAVAPLAWVSGGSGGAGAAGAAPGEEGGSAGR